MYQALYRKWRPQTFSDVVGQPHITETLKSQIRNGRLAHAYLFTGTRGTGKTTCAKILARAVNCEHPEGGEPCNRCAACLGIMEDSIPDVTEIDAASNNGVDNIRGIREEVFYAPAVAKRRIYIIDEVHMLSAGAFNALLKTLEEPPEHAMFILATTEVQKLPATILSRCQRFDFRRLSVEEIAGALMRIAKEEGLDLQPDGAFAVARLGDGSMRDALSVLERCASAAPPIDADAVTQALGLARPEYAVRILSAVADRSPEAAFEALQTCYDDGQEMGSLLDEMTSVCRDLLVLKTAKKNPEALLDPRYDKEKLREAAEKFTSSRLLAAVKVLWDTASRLRQGTNSRMEMELCFLALCSSEDRAAFLSDEEQMPRKACASAALDRNGKERREAEKEKESKSPEHAGLSTGKGKAQEKSAIRAASLSEEGRADAEEMGSRWAAVVRRLEKKLPRMTYVHLTLCSARMEQGDLIISAEDEMTASMVNTALVREKVAAAAEEEFGKPMAVRFAALKEPEKGNSAAEELARRAGELGIPVERE